MADDSGLPRPITRRDFLDGVALGLGASLLAPFVQGCGSTSRVVPDAGGVYPPALTGLRGSHDGVYAAAHDLKDGTFWPTAGAVTDTRERYDLIVVGGGISGLAAAHFFRERVSARARILVLDNHDDFGGHATRNEFRVGSRLMIGYGGAQSIESPGRYSRESRGLLSALGVDTSRFDTAFDRKFYESRGLGRGIFFDRETFGADRLVSGEGRRPWRELLADSPLSPAARRDIARVYDERVDYLRGLAVAQKTARLAAMSYGSYLLDAAKVHSDALPFFQTITHDLYGVGIDAVSALDCWGLGYPGFAGLSLPPEPAPRMGLTPRAEMTSDEPYIFHFPDGNASVARLLVRSLVPDAVPGRSMEDVVTSRVNYARLDAPRSAARLRLNSTVVKVAHHGDAASAREVEVTYVRGKQLFSARAAHCVLACWNGVIPHICPDLPEPQKEALGYGVKVPLVYANVALRQWTSFAKLGVWTINAPGGYFTTVSLDFPVSLGEYRFPRSPDEPIVVHMARTPCQPGLPSRDQHRAGRLELLSTPFETFERQIRDQLGRMLAGGGFDPARDIEAITVNRWAHGYSYEYNSLWDPDWPEDQRPCVIARRPFGRVAIANADAGASAYMDSAIDQAFRAVSELIQG
jgi:spermidine dehydrogenase